MSLLSVGFFIFLAAVFTLYFCVPKKYQWLALLAASWFFYIYTGLYSFVFLLVTTAVTYVGARMLSKVNAGLEQSLNNGETPREDAKRLKAEAKKKKRLIVGASLTVCFLILAVIKYYGFAMGNINAALGILGGEPISFRALALPLGISFYTYQSAGYMIDIYRGKYEACRNPLKYALFTSYFPQAIQGPISRYDRLTGELFAPHRLDGDNIRRGVQLFLWGCFKKIMIADRLAVLVGTVFGQNSEYGGAVMMLASLCYCVQLYCDFSGGIDVIRGVSQIMGIELPENFRQPFFAETLDDYWRRWHITLGEWMKDYLFYPVSLSPKTAKLGRKIRKRFGAAAGKYFSPCAATIIVFLAVGLWQGASWKWIAYGLYNGIIISLSMLLERFFCGVDDRLHISRSSAWFRGVRMLRTALIVCVGRYFSRAATLMTALSMLKRTFAHPIPSQLFNGTLMSLGLTGWDFTAVAIGLAALITVGVLRERGVEARERLSEKSFFAQFAVHFALLMCLAVFGVFSDGYIAAEFIYGSV